MRTCKFYDLTKYGYVDYMKTWKLQKLLVEQSSKLRKQNQETFDSLIFVIHPSVYTLGRGADPKNIKFAVNSPNAPAVYRIERGGEVTWHGPGQLVAYPIFDLNNHKRDLHWIVRSLEQTVIDTLAKYGVQGERSDLNTGVWVKKNKISAMGVTASRWITMHGLAINLNCDLNNFQQIVPCGITEPTAGVCRLEDLLQKPIDMKEFQNNLLSSFSNTFKLQYTNVVNPLEDFEALKQSFPDIASTPLDRYHGDK